MNYDRFNAYVEYEGYRYRLFKTTVPDKASEPSGPDVQVDFTLGDAIQHAEGSTQ